MGFSTVAAPIYIPTSVARYKQKTNQGEGSSCNRGPDRLCDKGVFLEAVLKLTSQLSKTHREPPA